MKKIKDTIIYRDDKYYSTFPSVVSRPDGEILVAFRRAPDRSRFFAPGYTHADPNSYLVLVRSRDLGRSWSEPELVHAHPMGGSQDPCMVQLDDGSLLVASYIWMNIPDHALEHAAKTVRVLDSWHMVPLGGYLVRSCDNGATWSDPIYPYRFDDQVAWMPGAEKYALNRGAMTQAADGNLYWLVVHDVKERLNHMFLELLVSRDRGLTWEHRSTAAKSDTVEFNETSMIQTPSGDLVAFVRTANFDDHTVIVRSSDMGKTWQPWEDTGIVGHPHHALQLPDKRVYLVYGYRHEPFGVRARVLDPECTAYDTEEVVLREDGGSRDIGYPWSCLTADGKVLSVYYFNQGGTRFIAGTYLEIE